MATTTHIGLTLLEQSQAQKEVTVNQAFIRLDALMNTGAIDKDLNTPPGSPSASDVYIVGPSPTGDWATKTKQVAYFDQVWKFVVPREGMTLWVNDENQLYTYDGSSWTALSGGGSLTLDGLSDVAVTSPAHNQVLKYDTVSGGWKNDTISGGTGTLAGLGDVTVSGAADNHFLVHNGTRWANESASTARGSLGLGTLATQNASAVTISGGSVSGITDLAVADGGTGASTATNARANLGLAIGTDVQGYDATLAALAGLDTITGAVVQTGTDTFAKRTLTGTAGNITVANGSGAAGNPTVDLASVGTAGTYDRVTTDAKGRVVSGSTLLDASTGVVCQTGAATFVKRTLSGGGGITLANADGVAGAPALGVSAKKALWLPASLWRPSASAGAGALAVISTGSGKPDVAYLAFDPSTDESAQVSVWMPASWNLGAVTAKVCWSHAASASNFGVAWTVQALATGDGDAIGASFAASATVTHTGGAADTQYVTAESSALSLAGALAGDLVRLKVTRSTANAGDTLAVDARLEAVVLYYTATTLVEG